MDPQQQPVQETPPLPSSDLEQRILEQDTAPDDQIDGFAWEASEYVAHSKSAAWYVGLLVIATILAAGLAWFRQWTGTALVAVMTFAVIVYSRKDPRTLEYAVDEQGIHINDKLHDYRLFKSYSLHPQVGWREIDFEPAKRFSQRLTVLCEEEDFNHIEEVLAQHLPRLDREPDFVEKLTRYVRF